MLWSLFLIAIAGVSIFWMIDRQRHRVRIENPESYGTAEAIEAQVESWMAQMSLRQKVAQLSGDRNLSVFSLHYGIRLMLARGAPLVYSGRNAALGIPPFAFADGPRGLNVGRDHTCFPVAMARGASWEVIDIEEGGKVAVEFADASRTSTSHPF